MFGSFNHGNVWHSGMRIKAVGDNEDSDREQNVFSTLIKDRIIFLAQEIDVDIASYIVANLLNMEKQAPNEEIAIYINSKGGDVQDALFTIHDAIQAITCPVKTVCIGEAYSSAAVILSSGTKGRRFSFPNGKMMIHNLQITDLSGTLSEMEREAKLTKDLDKRLMGILAHHTGQNAKKVRRDCMKDKYLSPEEAIKYGLIDAVLEPVKK